MQTSEEFWCHILAAPGDKNLLTQYIEALVHEGDARAEIFRLGTELKNLVHGHYEREKTLKQLYECALAPWRAGFDAKAETWNAEIKFVEVWPIELTIGARDFVIHAAEIVGTIPLRHLNLKAVNEAPEVFEVEQFQQIASLDGSRQKWTNKTIKALGESPCLESLRWVDLSHTEITHKEIYLLALYSDLRGWDVDYLDVTNNPCDDPRDVYNGYGMDWTGHIVPESIYLPQWGRDLEREHGRINWLHSLANFREQHPPSRYLF